MSAANGAAPKRFAFYGRVSTTDKQDPALSFPSQLKACERKVAELDGEVTCQFTDQESGAKQERPGWSALTHEARDREGRRFDAVVIYSTSRLARDRLYAALFERELSKVGVSIHYATGAGDPDTPEGKVFIGMQQLWDEFERQKLSRETKRGMREASEQGYRAGGRAPYGYRRREQELPADHRGDRDKRRVTLEPVDEEARVVAEIFELFVGERLSPKAIADRLNRPGGPLSPRHVDSARNLRGHWAASTIRAMLKNPVYTGRTVWNRLDFTEAKQSGGGAKRRAREEWVIAEDAHLAIVDDETFEAAQERFSIRARGNGSAHAKRSYALSGMVRCCAGHGPLSMQGKARKGHHYYVCGYATGYGEQAALEAHSGQKTVSVREDRLTRLVLRFFEQRIFGPLRLERLEKQLRAQARSERANGKLAGTRLRQQIAEIDRKIKAQVIALEDGVEPELVTQRIAELRVDKEALAEALLEVGAGREEGEDEELALQLARVPDLTRSLAQASPEVQRQVFQAFDLQIAYDKVGRRIEISATVSQAIADAFENTKALQMEGSQVVPRDIAGAGFEPATFGL
ncbi:MAG TPA: recombinase family protein [Solirubrobacterales bacterium]|nr:recombinase family protein [Solirubrobacterales bacterium]